MAGRRDRVLNRLGQRSIDRESPDGRDGNTAEHELPGERREESYET
ncbi:MAG: hypothetical protein ACRDJT_05250 [Actinomycetota bacterium]